MMKLARNLLAAMLAVAMLLGTAVGDGGNSNGPGTGGWVSLPGMGGKGGSNGQGSSYRVEYRVADIDKGVIMKLDRSMAGAWMLVDCGEGASALVASRGGFLSLPGPDLRALKDNGFLGFLITIVAPNRDVLTGYAAFDAKGGMMLRIR